MQKARGVSIREGFGNVVVLSEHAVKHACVYFYLRWIIGNNPIPGVAEQHVGFLGDSQLERERVFNTREIDSH